ncbi:MAG: M48 family metallopeptidase [Hydrogenophilaceae bacterium]|nr:M48 family metallopeptidase [Hydrogenophilaceae bacterium]
MKHGLASALLALALLGCTSNPITGRSQLILVSESQVIAQSSQAYRAELAPWSKQGKLNNDPALQARINGIADRLIAQAIRYRPETANWDWQIAVIDDPKTLNAFCLPGGRMAIYTGLIEKLQASDDELAQVIAHEIAHALANHGAEKMSVGLASDVLVGVIGAASGNNGQRNQQVGQLAALLAWQLPNSREAETEADRIGIELAARAGFDPKAAPVLWRKMIAAGGDRGRFDWLSTHPAPEKRLNELAALVPQMEPLYQEAKARPPVVQSRLANRRATPAKSASAANALERFKQGEAYLDCTSCRPQFEARLGQLNQLYQARRWQDLAQAVIEIGHAEDLAWYYLGAAAEGMGEPLAARRYYQLAIQLARHNSLCNTPSGPCGEVRLPEQAQQALRRLR